MKKPNNIKVQATGPKWLFVAMFFTFVSITFFSGVVMGGRTHVLVLKNDGTLCAEIK